MSGGVVKTANLVVLGVALTLLAAMSVVSSSWRAVAAEPSVAHAESGTRDPWSDALASLLRARALRGARVGVLVESVEGGARLLEHDPDRVFLPASNQKILTTAAALAHWGPAHRFETPVLAAGTLADGTLDGVLWFVGRGDPSLVSENVWKLAEEVRLRGVSRVTGGIGVDVSWFDAVGRHPDWGDARMDARAYHAPVGALAVNYSSFRIEVSAGEVGASPRVRVAPSLDYFRIRSDAVTLPARGRGGSLGLGVEPRADGAGDRVRLRGGFPADAAPRSYWRSVSSPTRYAASLLRAQLEAHGVRVGEGVQVGRAPDDAVELLRFRGDPMHELVEKLNKWSNNFVAEQLVKALGAESYGAPGSWSKGLRAVDRYLGEIGLPEGERVLADGSGLSPRNRVSPRDLVRVIRLASAAFDSGPEFLASLPLGGLDGTLEDRTELGEPPAPGGVEPTRRSRVRAKSGHLSHVAALSGLVPSAGDDAIVFSVLINGARGGREAVDAAIDAFVGRLSSLPLPSRAPAEAQKAGDSRAAYTR